MFGEYKLYEEQQVKYRRYILGLAIKKNTKFKYESNTIILQGNHSPGSKYNNNYGITLLMSLLCKSKGVHISESNSDYYLAEMAQS